MKIICAQTELQLLAGRAIFWPREAMLIVADTHLGKADHFQAAGVPVPTAANAAALARLSALIAATETRRLMVLGDFWHSPTGVSSPLLEEIAAWRARLPALDMDLVLGNHDRGCAPTPPAWNIAEHRAPLAVPPFVFAHYPESHPEGYTLAGHLHPSIALRGRGQPSLKLPCFWFGADIGVLPAFGAFTGTALIRPGAGDRIFAIADKEVLEVPA